MPEKLDELATKIIATLETQLAESIKKRDAIDGPRELKPPKFWKYQADCISIDTGDRTAET